MFMDDIDLNLDEDGNDDLYAEWLNSGPGQKCIISEAEQRTLFELP